MSKRKKWHTWKDITKQQPKPVKRTAASKIRKAQVAAFFRTLASLGFANYAEYLASPLWKQIREKAYCDWGYHCKGCGMAARVIHHTRYDHDTMRGLTTKYLVPLCHECHEKVHDGGAKGDAANIRLRSMMKHRREQVRAAIEAKAGR